MRAVLSKKDFKLIGISSTSSDRVIIELDKAVLDSLVGTKKRRVKSIEDMTLREYIVSGEVNNPDNISGTYENIDDLLLSLKEIG